MVIDTNVSAANSALLLGQSSSALSKSLARLSSGSKITSPADDSAGLAVSMKLGAQISRTAAAATNVGNATSYVQTQDGYLQKIGDALNRMSELTVAAQDATKTTSDRQIYNQEFQSLATYINDVTTKDFNGVSLFGGTGLNVTTDSDGNTFSMTSITGSYVTSSHPSTSTLMSSIIGSSTAGSVQLDPPGNCTVSINGTTTFADFLDTLNSTLNNSIGGNNGAASYNAQTGSLSVTINAGMNLFQSGGTILAALGLHNLDNTSGSSPATMSTTLNSSSGAMDLSSVSGAKSALTTIKNSINQLATDRAAVGSNLTRLNYTSDQLSSLQNNLAAAKSRITDVDVAQESTNYAKANILVQAGTAMLAQANAMPQSVLKLLG